VIVKKTLVVAIAVGISTIFALGYYAPNQHGKPTVTVAVSKTPLSAPFYIAEAQGFFNDTCVNVVLNEVNGGKKSFEQVMQSKADFGTSSDSVIAFKGLVRNDFVNLATFVSSDNDVKLIMRGNDNADKSSPLMGKIIGVTKGAAGDYFLSTYLALESVDPETITVIDLAVDHLVPALISGQVDAIVPWEPYAYQAIKQLNGQVSHLQTKNLHTLTFNLIGRKASTNKQLETTQCLLIALEQAIDFIAANPALTQSVLIERLDVDGAFIDWIWQDYVFKLSLNRSLLLNIESQALWAIESGLVDAKELPDYQQVLAPQALQLVNPMAVSL
jgi:sulfonate transport system substrate-binding protein